MADLHTYYDHASVAGDPTSDLRDALKAEGFDVVLAHTGGGCMCVDVILSGDGKLHAMVGVDESLPTATSGGADLFNEADADDPYMRSESFAFAAGDAVTHIAAWLKRQMEES